MKKNKRNFKLKGHESFYLREGWLKKGMSAIKQNPFCFSNTTDAIDELGIGANMVKSLRYWLQAFDLVKEVKDKETKKMKQEITEDFGSIIDKHDTYFEDLGTLFLLHYKLVKKIDFATSWYIFFNKILSSEMDKEGLEKAIKQEINNIEPGYNVSEKMVTDDVNCIIKTYYSEKEDLKDPEDNMICPLSQLSLINKHKNNINKLSPDKKNLDRLIVLYVICNYIEDNNETDNRNISIDDLINKDNNIGKVFNLDKNLINGYLDVLEREEYIKVIRTAGINMVQLTEKVTNKESILNTYYNE